MLENILNKSNVLRVYINILTYVTRRMHFNGFFFCILSGIRRKIFILGLLSTCLLMEMHISTDISILPKV